MNPANLVRSSGQMMSGPVTDGIWSFEAEFTTRDKNVRNDLVDVCLLSLKDSLCLASQCREHDGSQGPMSHLLGLYILFYIPVFAAPTLEQDEQTR